MTLPPSPAECAFVCPCGTWQIELDPTYFAVEPREAIEALVRAAQGHQLSDRIVGRRFLFEPSGIRMGGGQRTTGALVAVPKP